jgi:hypothetical protein
MAWILATRGLRAWGCRPGRIAGAAAMKRATVIAGLLLAVAGCASSPGPAVSAHGNCSRPFPGNGAVRACAYADGLYSVAYRDESQYYWRPAKGDFAVAETFYKQNAPGRAAGAWSGRTISVGDSCVISDNWIPSVTHPPSDLHGFTRRGDARGDQRGTAQCPGVLAGHDEGRPQRRSLTRSGRLSTRCG